MSTIECLSRRTVFDETKAISHLYLKKNVAIDFLDLYLCLNSLPSYYIVNGLLVLILMSVRQMSQFGCDVYHVTVTARVCDKCCRF